MPVPAMHLRSCRAGLRPPWHGLTYYFSWLLCKCQLTAAAAMQSLNLLLQVLTCCVSLLMSMTEHICSVGAVCRERLPSAFYCGAQLYQALVFNTFIVPLSSHVLLAESSWRNSDDIWGRAKICMVAARPIADYLVHAWNHRNACKHSGAVLPPPFASRGARGRWRCCYGLTGNMMMMIMAALSDSQRTANCRTTNVLPAWIVAGVEHWMWRVSPCTWILQHGAYYGQSL
jgi:hypothetical protein